MIRSIRTIWTCHASVTIAADGLIFWTVIRAMTEKTRRFTAKSVFRNRGVVRSVANSEAGT